MKQKALDLGKDDVWFENNKLITEGSSNNTFIISNNGTLITRSLSTKILPGITRKSILEYAKKANFNIEEKPFTIEDTKNAKEAFPVLLRLLLCQWLRLTTAKLEVVLLDSIPWNYVNYI